MTTAAPIDTYFWDHPPPGQDQGAHHISEINYVFNNLYKTCLPWQADDVAIAARMSAYWANFARTDSPMGDGKDKGLPPWTPTPANETVVLYAAAKLTYVP
jgi:carboxylesterase 2